MAGRQGHLHALVAGPPGRHARFDPGRRARAGCRGHRLDRLRPCGAHRKRRLGNLRPRRYPRRPGLRRREQRQGRRRAGADHRLRRAGFGFHGDPAGRVPDPRAGARPGHVEQGSGRDLHHRVVGGPRQYPGGRAVLHVLRPARQDRRGAPIHHHAADPDRDHGGRVPGQARLGRSLHPAVLRRDRLVHEAAALAQATGDPGRRAGRYRRALLQHLGEPLRCRNGGAGGPLLLAGLRPLDRDLRPGDIGLGSLPTVLARDQADGRVQGHGDRLHPREFRPQQCFLRPLHRHDRGDADRFPGLERRRQAGADLRRLVHPDRRQHQLLQPHLPR